MEFHGYIENRILRKKLMDIEVVHHHIGQIRFLRQVILGIKSGSTTHLEIFGQGKRIVVNRELGAVHQSLRPGFRLFQEYIHSHFRTCHSKDTLQVRTSAKCQTTVCQRSQETHIKGLSGKVDFSSPTCTIREMQQVTLRLQFECLRQSGFQCTETETIQIALGIYTETERLIRISLQKERIPSTQYFRYITFTDFGRDLCRDYTRLLHFEYIPTDFRLQIERRSGSFHGEIRNLNQRTVCQETTLGTEQFQSRLFLEHKVIDVGTDIPTAIINGIHLQANSLQHPFLLRAIGQFGTVYPE